MIDFIDKFYEIFFLSKLAVADKKTFWVTLWIGGNYVVELSSSKIDRKIP